MNKKRIIGLMLSFVLTVATVAGCGQKDANGTGNEVIENTETIEATEEAAAEAVSEEITASAEGETEELSEKSEQTNEQAGEQADAQTETQTEEDVEDAVDDTVFRVGSLKGPTTMGLVNLMKASEKGTSEGNYEFQMSAQPDEIMAKLVSGDLDGALVPANMASIMYNKTEGGVLLLNINTLGVLYCVTADESINSVADLAGKTVLTTGQGATPEYALNYLLSQNKITDCTLEFKSEATEIAALLQENPNQIAVLPQPFVTVACAQNDALKVAFGLTEEWDKVSGGSKLLTGVTVVRKDFYEEHKGIIKTFMHEQQKSAEAAISDFDTTSALVAEYGIIEKEGVARKALPECNIVCISGEDAKEALSGYLKVLFDQDPKSVGGKLPQDDFYLIQ